MVYVIILNWNGATDTIACIQSLARLNGPLPKVIVCDNASSDDSWSRLQSCVTMYPGLNIQLVQTGANLGFAGGNNVGLRMALSDPTMDFVWLLNNDTVVAPDSLAVQLLYMSQHPQVGICGSTLLYADEPERIQAVGGRYHPWRISAKHVLGHQPYSEALCRSVDPAEFDYVVGASMFVRRGVLEKVGLLSEDYFLYFEEIDWATRMKRTLPGMTLGYAPDSLVYHKEGASTQSNNRVKKTYRYFADYFFITSHLKFSRKHYPLRSLMVQASMLLIALNRIRRGQARSALVALSCFFGRIPRRLDPRRMVGR